MWEGPQASPSGPHLLQPLRDPEEKHLAEAQASPQTLERQQLNVQGRLVTQQPIPG